MTRSKHPKMPCTCMHAHMRAGVTPSLRGADAKPSPVKSLQICRFFPFPERKKIKKIKDFAKIVQKVSKNAVSWTWKAFLFFIYFLFIYFFSRTYTRVCESFFATEKKKKNKSRYLLRCGYFQNPAKLFHAPHQVGTHWKACKPHRLFRSCFLFFVPLKLNKKEPAIWMQKTIIRNTLVSVLFVFPSGKAVGTRQRPALSFQFQFVIFHFPVSSSK